MLALFVVSMLLATWLLLPVLSRQMDRIGWHLYYGSKLEKRKEEVETFASARNISEIKQYDEMKRWRVVKFAQAQEKVELLSILKYARNDDAERVIVWFYGQKPVRYLVLQRGDVSPRAELNEVNIDLGASDDHDITLSLVRSGFKQIWQGPMLDLENKRVGTSLDTARRPTFYYEAELTGYIWLYWETDAKGTILTRGMHDS